MKLKDIVRESRETYKGDMSGIPVVGLEHLIPEEICFSEYEMCSDKTFTKAFHKGQVLFGRRRAYQKKAAVAHVDGVCSGDIMVLEAIPGKVEPSLLPFIIQNDRFFDYAIQHSEGGLSPRVKWNAIANYEFDLPSIEEQKVLADKLWAAYKVKESYRQLLSTTDEMLKAKFQEMFGDGKGTTYSVKDLFDLQMGKTPDRKNLQYWKDGTNKWYSIADMSKSDIYSGDTDEYISDIAVNESGIKKVVKGTIFMSFKLTIGKVLIAAEDLYTNEAIMAFIPKQIEKIKLNQMWCFYCFKYKDWLEHAALAVKGKTLNKESIGNNTILLPPMELQQKFAEIATQAEATKASLRASIEAIDRVIKSLINQ